MPDPGNATAPAADRGGANNLLGGGSLQSTAQPTLGPVAQRVLDAHRERPWPDLDSFIANGNRRAQLARWAAHLATVALAPDCTSRDVQAAADRLLPLLQAVER